MAGDTNDSALTRVQPFFTPLFDGDPSGRNWLPALLAAAPHGRAALGELVENPGSIEIALAVRGANGRLACFDYPAAAPRELQAWFVEHPDELVWPRHTELSPSVARLRRALIDNDPPGARARAQDRAHDQIRTASPFSRDWWRFEEPTTLDCALLTDQLVLAIIGKRTEPLAVATQWFPARSELVRDLEAAKQLARGKSCAALVLSDELLLDASDEHFAQTLVAGAPHLNESDLDELRSAYLGNLTWAQAREAVNTSRA